MGESERLSGEGEPFSDFSAKMSFPLSFLLLLTPFAARPSLAFSVAEGGKSCSTFSKCVSLSSCPALLTLLNQVKMGDKTALSTLLASQCGFTKQLPMVCCPIQTKNPQTPLSSSSKPSKPPQHPLPAPSQRPKPPQLPEHLPVEPRAPDFSRLNHPKCGTRAALNFRVTFGRSASQGQYPWVAALIYTRGRLSLPLCGATLISRSHLLTLFHPTCPRCAPDAEVGKGLSNIGINVLKQFRPV